MNFIWLCLVLSSLAFSFSALSQIEKKASVLEKNKTFHSKKKKNSFIEKRRVFKKDLEPEAFLDIPPWEKREEKKREAKARGIILNFHKWPNSRQKRLILKKLKVQGLKKQTQ